MYQRGWYNAESPKLKYEDSSAVAVVHEIVHLLDYDSQPCIEDSNYRNDICRHDFIYKVHTGYFFINLKKNSKLVISNLI